MAAECATTAITRMARLLGVSNSGFYKRTNRSATTELTDREQRKADLTAKIIAHHRDSGGTYGSPRITADLRAAGEEVSQKTVAKIMAEIGLAGISPRKPVPPGAAECATAGYKQNYCTPADSVLRGHIRAVVGQGGVSRRGEFAGLPSSGGTVQDGAACAHTSTASAARPTTSKPDWPNRPANPVRSKRSSSAITALSVMAWLPLYGNRFRASSYIATGNVLVLSAPEAPGSHRASLPDTTTEVLWFMSITVSGYSWTGFGGTDGCVIRHTSEQ